MRYLLLLTGFILAVPAPGRAQEDETDKTVYNKKASAWMVVLRDPKAEVRQRQFALIALEQAGPQTRKIFEEVGSALRLDSEEIVRLSAAQVLGRLGAKALDPDRTAVPVPIKPAIDALIGSLTKEKAPAVLEAAAQAVGRIASAPREPLPAAKETVPALAPALKHASNGVRAAAAEALFRIGPASKEVLSDLAQVVRENKSKEQMTVRMWAAAAIQRIGRPDGLPAVTSLIKLLEEPEPAGLSPEERRLFGDVQRKSVEALGALGDVAAADILTRVLDRALETKDVTLGRTTLTALTQLAGEKKALLPALVKAMTPEPKLLQDSFIRCGAMNAIGSLGKDLGSYKDQVIRNLSQSLTDKISEVRLAAILALGELGPEVLGAEREGIISKLSVLRRSTEKAISEAADATIKRLEKS